MTLLHAVLGIAVVALNGAAAVLGLGFGARWESYGALAAWAHGTLVVQVASGFFLLTATSDEMTIWHYALPTLALAGVVAARSFTDNVRIRAIAGASLFATAVAVFSFVTGLG